MTMTGTTIRGKASRGAKRSVSSVPKAHPAKVLKKSGLPKAAGRGMSAADATTLVKSRGFAKLVRGNPGVARAVAELAAAGKISGVRSEKISARVDPGMLKAAAESLGVRSGEVSDVVNAALAVAAAPDQFKAWLAGTRDTLPDDFELAV
jgi:hypothetical protein